MNRPRALRVAAALALLAALGAGALADDPARRAAEAFGAALTSGRASDLRPVLPAAGKVQLSLERLGPEQGSFGPPQVEALFRDFLAQGAVASFTVSGQDGDGRRHALVHAQVRITDRQGRPARVGIHLVLQPEEGRWVVREIKETAE